MAIITDEMLAEKMDLLKSKFDKLKALNIDKLQKPSKEDALMIKKTLTKYNQIKTQRGKKEALKFLKDTANELRNSRK